MAHPFGRLVRPWREGLAASALGAVVACGSATSVQPVETVVAPVDVSGLASVQLEEGAFLESVHYFAFLGPLTRLDSWGEDRGPQIALEKSGFNCQRAVEDYGDPPAEFETCPATVAEILRRHEHRTGNALVVIDEAGAESVFDSPAALGPIDSPQKAMAAVWIDARYVLANPEDNPLSIRTGFVSEVPGGWEVITHLHEEEGDCASMMAHHYQVRLLVRPDGAIEETARAETAQNRVDGCHPLGRRPEGFVDCPSGGTLRGLLARMVHQEAESVRAFDRLGRELRAHGAPDELVRAAAKAADDERRHARLGVELATALQFEVGGFEVDAPSDALEPLPIRSLAACAMENALEGCVGETYAAAVALYQSAHAQWAPARRVFAEIAEDELDHAALAHACKTFFDSKLSASERAAQDAAARREREALRASFAEPNIDAHWLGFPPVAHAQTLLDAVQ